MRALISLAERSGRILFINAATPVTYGAAYDVPDLYS